MKTKLTVALLACSALSACSAGVGRTRVDRLATLHGASSTPPSLASVRNGASVRTGAFGPLAPAPMNATCPVLVGTPVNPEIRSMWQGRVVAFADASSRTAFEATPERYVGNLPRGSGSAGDAFLPSTARVIASVPIAPSAPAPVSRPVPVPPPTVVLGAVRTPGMSRVQAGTLATRALSAPVPAGVAPVARKASGAPGAPGLAPAAAGAVAAASGPVVPSAEAAAPADEDATGEECQDCPGGHCRLPGR